MESPRACNSRAICFGQVFTQSGEVVTRTTHGPNLFFLNKNGHSFSVMVSSWEFAYPEILFFLFFVHAACDLTISRRYDTSIQNS